MSRGRILLLFKLLYISDRRTEDEEDSLHKLRPVLAMLKKKFKEVFKPFQNLVMDESLTIFKGRLVFKQ